jgi:hypothetical protein
VNNFFLSPENGRYYLGVQFTYEGRIYPGTLTSMNALGFTEVVVQPMPNPTYYVVGNVNDDGTWNSTPRSVPDVKANQLQKAQRNTYNTLQPSDWYVVRQQENGTPIPENWNSYRQGCRVAYDDYAAAINAADTLDQLEAIGSVVYFPPSPDNKGGFSATLAKGQSALQIVGNPLQATAVLPGMFVFAEGFVAVGTKVTSVDVLTGTVTLDKANTASGPENEPVGVQTSWVAF